MIANFYEKVKLSFLPLFRLSSDLNPSFLHP
jgi:hypothetical protein